MFVRADLLFLNKAGCWRFIVVPFLLLLLLLVHGCHHEESNKSILTMRDVNTSSSRDQGAIESALANLQPLRDLSRNWDVDIASW